MVHELDAGRTKTRIFLEKDRDARVDRVVVPTPAISLSA
jgi:hypothetical protein